MEYILTFKIQQCRLLCGFPQKPHHIQNLPLKLSFQSQRILAECDHDSRNARSQMDVAPWMEWIGLDCQLEHLKVDSIAVPLFTNSSWIGGRQCYLDLASNTCITGLFSSIPRGRIWWQIWRIIKRQEKSVTLANYFSGWLQLQQQKRVHTHKASYLL